jgi:hypothetical protein
VWREEAALTASGSKSAVSPPGALDFKSAALMQHSGGGKHKSTARAAAAADTTAGMETARQKQPQALTITALSKHLHPSVAAHTARAPTKQQEVCAALFLRDG